MRRKQTASVSSNDEPNNDSRGSRKGTVSARHSWGVYTSRVVFLSCLVVVATVLGFTAHRLLTTTEKRLAREQFKYISDCALSMAQKIAKRQKLGVISLASVLEQLHPNADEWPFVHVNGFQVVAHNVMETSSGMSMGLMPIVTPEELTDFEDYAYNVVMNGNALTDRMYGLDQNGQKYNETDGSTYWDSPNKIFTPFFQHSSSDVFFLLNWHSIEARGRLVDDMIQCSMERAREMQENVGGPSFVPKECSYVTDIVDLRFKVPVGIPAAVSVQPIYPANNPSVLTGFITSAIKWEDVMLDVFSKEVSGVDCVLKTETRAFTYEIAHGVATLKGEGDLHDPNFDEYGDTVVLTGPGPYKDSSPTYVLSAYPNENLFEVYETSNPFVASVGSVCIILFTSILFSLYDFFVRTEFHRKESLSSARRQFVRFISHEVRTPLNAVCMALQLLHDEIMFPSRQGPGNEMKEHSVAEEVQRILKGISELEDDIRSNARSAVDVLNDLLNYDKIESGTLYLELSMVPIFELIERTVAEFRQPARLKRINYSLDFSPLLESQPEEESGMISAWDLPDQMQNFSVIGDASRLSQVLRNLISNAVKFTPDDGSVSIRTIFSAAETTGEAPEEALQITLHSGETATYFRRGTMQVEVTDTGAGMTSDQLKNLFKEGVQFDVNELQAGQGSGLGLYIAKGILDQHGGTLSASSKGKGLGSTCTMNIPLCTIPDAACLKQNVKSHRPVIPETPHPLNILVVDDSNVNRKLLSRLLQRQGHSCTEAEDGKIAVQAVTRTMAKQDRYDVILMDCEMPVMNGLEATREIRALQCDSFIVGVTGTLFREDVDKFKKCGADSVLPKPLEMHSLTELLRTSMSSPSTPKESASQAA